jgi:hypothetical protein
MYGREDRIKVNGFCGWKYRINLNGKAIKWLKTSFEWTHWKFLCVRDINWSHRDPKSISRTGLDSSVSPHSMHLSSVAQAWHRVYKIVPFSSALALKVSCMRLIDATVQMQ